MIYLIRNAIYRIIVDNRNKVGQGVSRIKVDGNPILGNLVPPFSDNSEHIIEVFLAKESMSFIS